MNYGCKYFRWALVQSDDDKKAMPTYDAAKDIGGINEVDETLNFAEAKAYADDAQKIAIREFTDGDLSTQVLYQEVEDKAVLLGCDTDNDGGLIYGGDDNQPFVGGGFYHTMMDAKKKKYYEVIFYPKLQAYVEGKNNATKADSINLEYEPVNFYVYQAECEKFKIEKRFDSEDDAIEYLDGLFTGDSVVELKANAATPASVKTTSAKATTSTTTTTTTAEAK